MSQDKEREAFEAWAEEAGFYTGTEYRKMGDPYLTASTKHAWTAWQARAALASQQAGKGEPVAYRYSVQPQVLGPAYWVYSERKDVPDAQPLYASPPSRELQWQPIETAPKDGTDVLVMYMHIDTQVVHNAFYNHYDPDDDPDDDPAWWSYDKSEVSRVRLDGFMTPTHWMPLPPPPGIHSSEGETK